MALNLVHDDYFSLKGNIHDGIILDSTDENSVFNEPISVGGKYFVPILDLFANTLLENVTIRDKFQNFDSVEKLPFSVRFSVGAYQHVLDRLKAGKSPLIRLDGRLFFVAGFLLDSEDRTFRIVTTKVISTHNEQGGGTIYSTARVRFISYDGEERILPVTTYKFNDKMEPIDTISDEKQFVDFIDMERRFYAKTAFFVIDHYRLGGRSLSKIVDFDLDR